MSERSQRLEELFATAAELPGDDRASYLDHACADDPELRAQVERLLRSIDHAGSFLTKAEDPGHSDLSVQPGDSISRYKLLEKLGEGGFGAVYMAEQREPVKRRVALKIIKAGMDTKEVVARFAAERQALALMDHPNIAKVFDAGATENGRPYFVLELVRGIKITKYCEQNHLDLNARLKLFIQVCQAVQHAHQKGVIHRDLKPSNILVTLQDGNPVPKVIDFGIAKATQGDLTEKTVFTRFHQFIGTPAYMSPEQAELSSLDIDTRSDIYSLGVLLYELLTGTTPFDAQELLKAGLDEMRRTIREVEPLRPSTRVSTLNCNPNPNPRSESTLRNPQSGIASDLDWIVMKCLDKNRSRRYDTANGIAADIQRHFANEPILARPPSAAYRFQKAVRRNKVAFTAAGAIAFSLVLGLGLAIWQANRAQAAQREQMRLRLQAEESAREAKTEALRSERVSKFFQDMLKGVGPAVARGRDTTLLREILDKTVQNLSTDLKEEPSVEAQLRNTVGQIYLDLGDLPRAEAMGREALALRLRLNGGEHKQVARSLELLGMIHDDRKEYAQAEAVHREALALRRRLFGDWDQLIAFSLNSLGSVQLGRGDLAGAEASFRQAMEISRRNKGEEGFVAMTLGNLGVVHSSRGEYAEAEKLLLQSLESVRREKGNDDPHVANSLEQLALVFADQSKLEEAERFNREALAIYRKIMGENHPELARPLQNLGHILRLRGNLAGVEAAYREALAICRQSPGQDDRLALALYTVSNVLQQRRQFKESESLMIESLAIRKRLHGPESQEVADALSNLAAILGDAGDNVKSELYSRECLAIRRKLFGPDHPAVAGILSSLGWALANQNRLSEAEETFLAALDSLDRSSSAKPEHRRLPLGNMFSVLSRQKKFAELESFLEKRLRAATDPGVKALYLNARGNFHARYCRWPTAAAEFVRAIELQPDNHEHYHELAPLLVANGDLASYRKHCARAVEQFRDTKDPNVAERMAKDCLIRSDSGVDLGVVTAWTDLAVTAGKDSAHLAYFQHAKGLAEYRRQRFAEAAEWAGKALSQRGEPTRDPQASAVLAMAQHRLGQTNEARATLTQALELEGALPKLESGDIGDNWLDWIIARTLIREARSLIEGGSVADLAKTFSTPEASP